MEGLTCDLGRNPLGVDEPHPLLHWTLQANAGQARGIEQAAFQILVATSRAKLAQNTGDVWDSGKTAAPLAPAVPYAGAPLASDQVYAWKVRVWDRHGATSPWSEVAVFQTGLLNASDWHGHWIAATADEPRKPQARGNDDTQVNSVPPLPIFRHDFAAGKPIARATLFISGLGQQETFLNGQPVTRAVLTPGWTDYRKTIFYDTFDVTSLLKRGKNTVGVMLGNGMYNVQGLRGRYTKFVGSYGQPKLIAELRIHYADGSNAMVASDGTWKVTAGPIVFSSIYGGEDYDARKLPEGWARPGFREEEWKPVLPVDGPGGQLRSERLTPVEPERTYAPIHVARTSPGVSVYDLGQNLAGRPAIALSGPAGASVSILPGELLDASGRVSQQSQNASPQAPVIFHYTLSGHGEEQWSPQFTYTGFRYAEVSASGSGELPAIKSFVAQALHDAAPVDGSFTSSDDLLNRIHKLIDAAIENNMVSVLTDCPTREKLGWLEQTHLAATSILYNYDLSALYRKMARDMRDAQLPSGMVPAIAPEVVAFLDDAGNNTDFRDSPEWGSAMILSPWTAYTFFGDTQVLRDNYDAMELYANYLQSRMQDGLISYGLGDWYDIGPADPGVSQLTGKGMTATAIYFQDLTALARIAAILNKPADAARFSSRAASVKASINAQLFHPGSDSYDRGSQTANAMALALGLVPDGHVEGVLNNLVADIRKHDNHVTAGDIGFHYVVRALTDHGRSDVLYDMLKRTDSPSYGYQLKHGATALTEAWDANPTSSQDHFMLGHAEEWFYRGLAGIDFNLDRERDRRIWIRPQIAGDLTSAAAEYKSVLGPIRSGWKRYGDTLRLDVSIPPGATATISFPPEFTGRDILESGHIPQPSDGILSMTQFSRAISYVLGSGNYHFEMHRN